MNSYYCILLIVQFRLGLVLPSGLLRTGVNKQISGYQFDETVVLNVVTLRHFVLCIAHCDDVTDCLSVSWNKVTGTCQMSDVDIIHERHVLYFMELSSDWTAAVKIRYKVFNMQGHARYTLTFPEAVQECSNNGYVIADQSDMIEARDTGFCDCVCGWISDGTNVVIMQQNNAECWHVYTDGYEICGKDYADVWCKWN